MFENKIKVIFVVGFLCMLWLPLLNTNLQFIEPTEYLITYPFIITILEYKVNEISNKQFYIEERKEKYNLKEIETFLRNFQI